MKLEKFAELVKRLEEDAARAPAAYRIKVGLLAALGYGFILGMLGICIALLAVTVWAAVATGQGAGPFISLALFFAVTAFVILRALWVTFEKPKNIPLSRDTALPLFQAVDRLTEKLGAPRFHRVLLTDEYNASAVQRPRLGVFGWQENYLLVGLPLLQALSPEHFEGVLAHELGHLRGGHGRFGGWTYRVNQTWQRLLESRRRRGGSGKLLEGFFGWYAPLFHAYSFTLNRADEYVADRCAAEMVGGGVYAEALCLIPAHGDYFHKSYWKRIYDRHRELAVPDDTPYTGLIHAFRASEPGSLVGTAVPAADAERALRDALLEETGFADTHPSLADRLKALGQEPRLPAPFPETAAEAFLGPHLPRLAAEMDAAWHKLVAPRWKEMHEKSRQEREKLAELDARAAAAEPLPLKDAWQRAEWTEEYKGEDAALPLYREIAGGVFGDGPGIVSAAEYAAGRLLLEKDDPAGIPYLERAMAKEPDAVIPSQRLLFVYHKRRGDDAAAKAVYQRALRHADLEQEAEKERAGIGGRRARFLPHGLTEEQIAPLAAQLAKIPNLGTAYLVRKDVKYLPEKPLYVLGVTLSLRWYQTTGADKIAGLLHAVTEGVELPGQGYVVVLEGAPAAYRGRLEKTPGSRIYAKAKKR